MFRKFVMFDKCVIFTKCVKGVSFIHCILYHPYGYISMGKMLPYVPKVT